MKLTGTLSRRLLARPALFLSLIAGNCALLTSSSNAAIITPELGAGADAYIHSGTNGNSNFGTSTVLNIKNDNNTGTSANNRKDYIRFDLATLGFGLNEIDTVTLQLRATANPSASLTVNVFGLNDVAAGSNPSSGDAAPNSTGWIESGTNSITWNNAPANNTSSSSQLTSEATSLGTFSFSTSASGTDLQFTSAALKSFIQNDSNGLVTIVLTSSTNSANVAAFSSKEGAVDPQLIITQVPEPGTALLALIGGAGLLLRGRRRA